MLNFSSEVVSSSSGIPHFKKGIGKHSFCDKEHVIRPFQI